MNSLYNVTKNLALGVLDLWKIPWAPRPQ